MKRIDNTKHAIRFSPRRPGSIWAPSNIQRVKKLIREKKMTKDGLKLFKAANLKQQTAPTVKMPKRLVVPPDLWRALADRPKVLQHFANYPPSFRLLTIHWITTAKHEKTRQRRIRNVVSNAASHAKPTY